MKVVCCMCELEFDPDSEEIAYRSNDPLDSMETWMCSDCWEESMRLLREIGKALEDSGLWGKS